MLAPAKTLAEMSRVVVNDYVDATLAAVFVAVVVSIVIYALITIRKALATPTATARTDGARPDAGSGLRLGAPRRGVPVRAESAVAGGRCPQVRTDR